MMINKKYSEFMDEISGDELYEGLLAYGFFSEKLPPIFTAVPFYDYCMDKKIAFNSVEHDYISFSSMRNINIPRQLGIPTPMKYQRLCECLKENWDLIKLHFHNNTDKDSFRVSRIHLRKIEDCKAIFKMDYKRWYIDGNPETDLLMLSSGPSKYIVKADISTCFPSIYSHSIPWALVGKAEAKKNKNEDKNWYNKIDSTCQKITNGQTHGILIGPHSSNLISEIILTVVDRNLQDKGNYRYVRYIDDYHCYVNSLDEAQRFLRDLEDTLKEFDLPLNHKKTTILELPISVTENWVHRLNSFPLISKYGTTTYKEVNAYLDLALELKEKNNDANASKFRNLTNEY